MAGLRIQSSGLGPWPRHHVVFLGNTLNLRSATLHSGVCKRVPANLMLEGNCAMDHPGGMGERDEIFLVASR